MLEDAKENINDWPLRKYLVIALLAMFHKWFAALKNKSSNIKTDIQTFRKENIFPSSKFQQSLVVVNV